MSKLLLIFITLLLSACVAVSNGIPKESKTEFGVIFNDFKAYISGTTTYQEMAPDIQIAYMKNQKEIEILKLLLNSEKVSVAHIEKYLKLSSVPALENAIKNDESLPPDKRNELVEKIANLSSSLSDIEVVQLPDQTKGKQIAGKLAWHPTLRAWVKQVVLYNDAPLPDRSHPIWSYTSKLIPPKHEGRSDWDVYGYKLFNI